MLAGVRDGGVGVAINGSCTELCGDALSTSTVVREMTCDKITQSYTHRYTSG